MRERGGAGDFGGRGFRLTWGLTFGSRCGIIGGNINRKVLTMKDFLCDFFYCYGDTVGLCFGLALCFAIVWGSVGWLSTGADLGLALGGFGVLVGIVLGILITRG